MFFWKCPEYNIVTSEKELEPLLFELKDAIANKLPISIDVETTGPFKKSGLDPYNGWLLGISFCTSTDKGYYIPLAHTKNGKRIENQLTLETVRNNLNPILSTNGLYIGHNIKFDYKFLLKSKIELFPRCWCTNNAAKMVYGDKTKKTALKTIISNYVDIPHGIVKTFDSATEDDTAETNPIDMAVYAINDVIFTYYLYKSLKPEIDKNYYKLFYEAESPLLPLLAQIEIRGTEIDVDYYKNIKKPAEEQRKELKKFFKSNFGITATSNPQVAKLFNSMKIPLLSTKSGATSVGVESLNKALSKYNKETNEYKLISKILDLRQIEKALTSYVNKFPKIAEQIHKKDKIHYILHTDFNQIISSGRMSASPSLQTLTREGPIDIRKGFIPREGYCFVEGDWSSNEYRLVTIVSKDPVLREMYINDPLGADIHSLTAKELGIERQDGKTVNFALIYGATEYAISTQLGCSKEEAKEFIKKYFNTYKGVAEWITREKNNIRKNRYTSTLFGRRRYLREDVFYGMKEFWKYDAEVRALINHIIQGTAADLLKFAMVNISKKFAIQNLDAYIVTTSHDSITSENTQPKEVKQIMKEVMEVTIDGIFMPVDIEVRNSFSKE